MEKQRTLSAEYPALASQWHPTRNGDLSPEQVTAGSNRKVWWLFRHDDPQTGQHFDFEWQAVIQARVKGPGCPFLSGRAVWPGFNDLRTLYPDLALQWHPTKNGDLSPEQVPAGSNRKVWWLFRHDDPQTGRRFDFEWQAVIKARVKNPGCPFLSGRAVWPGFNDLRTLYPDLALQWHPAKNGDLSPEQVAAGSNRKVWWLFRHDNPQTGQHFDFEWQAVVQDRVKEPGCPFLSGHAVWPGFNDLRTLCPDLASQWHPTKNGRLTPDLITENSSQPIWWCFPYDDPVTKTHFDFEWISTVHERTGINCPFLSGKRVWAGFNDLQTKSPEVAKEWHPTKNKGLKPSEVTNRSSKKVWWCCSVCGYEWRTSIIARTRLGTKCPLRKKHSPSTEEQ